MAETEIVETTALARLEPQDLLKTAIEKGSDIATIERFVALAERVHAIQAKDAYLRAMAKFKAKCPPLVKMKVARMPKYSYKFAPLGYIADQIDPVLGECGLSYRWTTPKIQADKVTIACIVAHELGHEESSGDLEMPIPTATQRTDGTGEGGANPMQRVGIAMSYAERYSLMAVLGLAAEDDTDGHDHHGGDAGDTAAADDGPIPQAAINKLKAIQRGQGWTDDDLAALLKKHGLASVADIPNPKKYDEILNAIKAEKKAVPTA
jgi:hypothetical protein